MKAKLEHLLTAILEVARSIVDDLRQLADDLRISQRWHAFAMSVDRLGIPDRIRDIPVVLERLGTSDRLRDMVSRAGRVRVPDGARVAIAGFVTVAVILGIGLGFGRLSHDDEPAVATPSSPPGAPAPEIVAAAPEPPAEWSAEAGSQVMSLRRINPITGPDQPPLPEDEFGPYGSRRTTGTYEVALTFDDGPDPQWTPVVLEVLRQHRIKATFCVLGVNVVSFPHLVRAIDADGHTLCNHSWGHDIGLGKRGFAAIIGDMSRTNEAIRAAAPRARVSYFRHPGGAWTQNAVSAARQLGMSSLHWDVDPRDWLKPGSRAISSAVVTSTGPGAIVLLHDGGGDRRGTAEALRSILPNLAARFPLVALPPGTDAPRLHGIDLPIHLGQQ